MLIKNTQNQFGAVTKSFHWGIALIVVCLLIGGHLMHDLPDGTIKLVIYNLHKSLGITVLTLTLCRLLWNNVSERPHLDDPMPAWEKPLARPLQNIFYVLLLAMPLTGWIFSSAAGRPVHFFGLFTLPDLVSPDKPIAKFFRELHGIISYIIISAVALHVGSVLKHHFIDKDEHLKRMLPALLIVLFFSTTAHAADPKWIVDYKKSSITFTGKQMGEEFKGSFVRFTAAGNRITFDPGNPAGGGAKMNIDIASVSTQSAERDDTIKGEDWFDVAQFPWARFETTAFRKTGDGTYEALANLTIRDVTLPVTLPFTLKIAKEDSDKNIIATMDASITLDRSKFHLGTGSWVDTSVIANEVPVSVHVVAYQEKAEP